MFDQYDQISDVSDSIAVKINDRNEFYLPEVVISVSAPIGMGIEVYGRTIGRERRTI